MVPQELTLNKISFDKLKVMFKTATFTHGYAAMVDDEYTICTKSVDHIMTAPGPHVLLLHAPRGTRDMIELKMAYSSVWHRLSLVVWDTTSPNGKRSHVRYWGFKLRRKIVGRTAYVFDDDFRAFVEYRPDNKPQRPHLEFIEFFIALNAHSENVARPNGVLVWSVSDSTDRMNTDITANSACTGRSGLSVEHHDMINMRKSASWNMYATAKRFNMTTNEDILSTALMLPSGEFKVYKNFAVIGDRLSNDPMNMDLAECATILLCVLPTNVAFWSLRTKFSYEYGILYSDNLNVGWLEGIKNAVMKLKAKYKKKTLNYYAHRDEIWALGAKETEYVKNKAFIPIYRAWLKEQKLAA